MKTRAHRKNHPTVHRLTASLAFLLRLSPFYEGQLVPLLQVLQCRMVMKGKLAKGGCGEDGVGKKEVRRLVMEVAEKLCP
jgi:desumoylating isopeptidase 1